MELNIERKIKRNRKKSASETISQKIDNAEKKRYKARTAALRDAVTISPAEGLNAPYTAVGLVLRTLTLFMGILGLNLFLFDAIKLVILNSAKSDNITVSVSSVVLWCALCTIYVMLLSLTKITRILSPVITLGGAALYAFLTYSDPIDYFKSAFRCLLDLIFENMGAAGYTTYMQYISDGVYSYSEEELIKTAACTIVIISGLLLGLFVAKRVKALGVAFICALYMIPVFTFNITRTNKGLAVLLIFVVGIVATYLSDCLYGGIFAARKQKKEAKKAAKLAAKQEKKDKKKAKSNLKNASIAAYNNALERGMLKSDAKKAKAAVIAKAKKEEKDKVEALKKAKISEKLQKKEDKKQRAEEKKAARIAFREEKKKNRAKLALLKKSKSADDKNLLKQIKDDEKVNAKNARLNKYSDALNTLKVRSASGFAGGMAMLIAAIAVWIPYTAVSKNFPIIDVINNKMQLARTYVTAYLMGDDIDLNSLSMYGGVAELNPRSVDFNTPQYTGQKLFSVDVSYQAPVYMRSWIGSDYNLDTDSWQSADADEVIAYRSRFGNSYSPDNISYFFAKYVYPNALEVNKVNQYRNLDEFGFRVFQVHVQRVSGNSRILFVPSIMNAALGIMEYGSIEPNEVKYSAYYDGIYSSRFFNEGVSYSTSSFNPVMKHPDLAENLEGSIEYYMLCKKYADAIDTIESDIADTVLWDETKEYTHETAIGEITFSGNDLSFMLEMFEEDVAEMGYKYKAQSFVEMYLAMTSGERKQFHNAYASELNYRDYTEETYRTTFGSEKITALANEILADNGIVMGEKPEWDKSYQETKTENQIKRMTAEEKYGNNYESWFTDAETGETIPRHTVIMAVINYLRNNYTYTIYPNCPTKELLDEDGNVVLDENGEPVMIFDISEDSNLEAFLFDVKEGYCVHFATSAVAILRELGFAVRYDEGYIASRFSRTYAKDAAATYRSSVRDYDAHAWIEIYYPAIGWMTYECTPSYCEMMYDLETTSSTTSSTDNSKITVSTNTDTDTTSTLVLGDDTDEDYIVFIVLFGVIAAVLVIMSIVWAILRRRALKAVKKRQELVSNTVNEEKFMSGETDVHDSARKITDAVFDILAALGMPHETGELPAEYAQRVETEYGNISGHKITDVMDIIEKEEFGGKLSFRELRTLAEYLKDIESSVYSSLPAGEKLRMRYIMNVI